MSLLKHLLDKMQEQEGIYSGNVNKDKDGKLLPHPSSKLVDPVSTADFDSRHEFEKDVDKKVKGEAQELESGEGGDIPHTHKYIPGKNRSEEELGHDHPLIYKNGKVVGLDKGPHEGHYHEV